MKKRFLSYFLAISFVFTMMPTIAFAVGDSENESEGTTEACTVTDGCTLAAGHDGECVVADLEEEPESVPCTVTEGCTLAAGHDGECVVASIEEDDENELPDADNKDIVFDQFAPEKVMESTNSKLLADADDWTECTHCSEDNPHLIATTADLDKIRTHIHTGEDGTQTITGYFKLANDIVFSDEDFEEGGAFYNNGQTWIPIGHKNLSGDDGIGEVFCGSFDGDGYRIENIKICPIDSDKRNRRYSGVFMMLGDHGIITNVEFDHISNSTKHAAGIPVGDVVSDTAELSDIIINNCEIIPEETSNNGLAPSIIAHKLMGTVSNIVVENCRYGIDGHGQATNGAPWYSAIVANCIDHVNINGITIANCDFGMYTRSYLLFALVDGENTVENISIKNTKVTALHRDGRALIGGDDQSKVSLKNIHVDIIYDYDNTPLESTIIDMIPENMDISLENISLQYQLTKNTKVENWWPPVSTLAKSDEPISVSCTYGENNKLEVYLANKVYYVSSNTGDFDLSGVEFPVVYLKDGIFINNPVTQDGKLPVPVQNKNIFLGWYESGTNSPAESAEAGKTYYAKWEPSTYTVTSDLNFGKIVYGSAASQPIEVTGSGGTGTLEVADNDIFDTVVNEEDHTITVTPHANLSAGSYEETLYVTTPDGATFFVPVTLEIVRAGSELAIWANGSENLTLSGGGEVTLSITGDVNANEVTVACNDENIEIPANEDGTYTVTLPNETADYTFTATYAGDDNHEQAEDTCTVSVTRRTGGGASHPEADSTPSSDRNDRDDADQEEIHETEVPLDEGKIANFDDVPADAWYAEAVQYVYERDLMTGVSENLFAPNAQMNRAMLAQILFNMEQPDDTQAPEAFRDVAADQWYAEAVNWAVWQGYMSGYGSGNFGPNDALTREQLVTVLWRYCGSPAASNSAVLNTFADAAQISDYAVQAMAWACEQGVISGNADGTLTPNGTATRAEIAQILMNYCENIQ